MGNVNTTMRVITGVEDKEKVFMNFRCRKCGCMISKESPKSKIHTSAHGMISSNQKYHLNCPKKIEQEENIYMDLISWSPKPLEEAIDIYYMDDDKDENNEGNNNKDE